MTESDQAWVVHRDERIACWVCAIPASHRLWWDYKGYLVCSHPCLTKIRNMVLHTNNKLLLLVK